MTDAFGVTEFNGFADMEAESFGWDETGSELASVEGDLDARIDAVKIVEHPHLAVVFGHGVEGVFGLNKVDADDVGILRCELKSEERLREDLLRTKRAEYLIEKTNLDRAGRRSVGLTAVLDVVAEFEGVIELFAVDGNFVAKATSEKCGADVSEIRRRGSGGVAGAIVGKIDGRHRPGDRSAELGYIVECRRAHDFEVLFVLRRGAGSHFVEPFAVVRVADLAKAIEGVEELIVAAVACAGDEVAHGERVNQCVVKMLVGKDALSTDVTLDTDGLWRLTASCADIFCKAKRGRVYAKQIGGGVFKKGFGVDCAGEMHVQIGTLGHLGEEGSEL